MKYGLNLKFKLLIGGSLSLVLFSILSVLSVKNIDLVQDTFWRVDHTQEILMKAKKIEKLIVDMETGQRGFLISGNEEFLEPYNRGRDALPKILNEAKELVRDNLSQVERIINISALTNEWQEKAGAYEIDLRRQVNRGEISQSEVVTAIESKLGKNLMDNLRGKLEKFKSIEVELMTVREREAKESIQILRDLIIFGSILAIVVSFIVFSRISRKITTPILSLVNVSRRVSTESLVDDIPQKGKSEGEGEIAELVQAYYKMLSRLRDEIADHNKTSKEVEKFEETNRMLLATTDICLKEIHKNNGPGYTLLFMSPAGQEQLGIKNLEELYNGPYPPDFYPDGPKRALTEGLDQVVRTGKSSQVECELFDTHGNPVWYLSTFSVHRSNEAGEVVSITGSSQNITQRKKIEKELEVHRYNLEELVKERTEALTKSQNTLSNLISNLDGMVYHCKNNKDWTMDFVSRGSLALTGHKPEDIERNNVISYNEIIHPDDREAVWDGVQKALKNEEPFILNYRIMTSEGKVKYVWEQGRGVWLENGELEGLQGFITDVSELVMKTHELERSERKFKSYFQMPLTGVAIFDTKGRWIELNDRMCEIVGYRREELMGFVWTDATHPEDIEPCMHLIDEIKSKKRDQYTIEKRYVGKNGEITPVEASVGCIRDKEGNPEFYVALVQDISERKKYESELKSSQLQLIHSEKLASLGKLTGSISHEFNNPLQGIKNVINILGSSIPSEKKVKFVKLGEKECDRMAKMIQGLRDFYKPTSDKVSSVDINQCIEEVLSLQTISLQERCIQINQQFSEGIPLVEMVEDQLKQVLLNLVQNAADSISGEGQITLITEKQDSHVIIKIQDTGHGISEDDQKNLFEPFFSTKEGKGTGLGLSISYGIIHDHGGDIVVKSGLGKGATFTISLPIKGKQIPI